MRSGRNAHHTCDKFQSWPWETPGFSGGGLDRVAADLVNLFPEQIGSPTMCRVKKRTGDYQAADVMALRKEIPVINATDYRVRGEVVMEMFERDMTLDDAKRRASTYPSSYPVKAFLDLVDEALRGLPQYVRALCLDRTIGIDRAGVWYITGLLNILRKYKQRFEAAVQSQIVSTEISRRVHQTLELALSSRGMTLTEGNPREGKSTAAQYWSQQRLGQVRYVQLESSNDEGSFLRSISQALGTPCNPELKAFEMKSFIQETLSAGDLMLVFDEADQLWPRTIRPVKAPARIEWINTALKNRSIPVAMVGTNKFSECMAVFDKKCTVWATEQFMGRLADHQRLPAELSDEDLRAIARHLLPSATNGMLNLLAALAKRDEGYVATIERAVQKARFIASQSGSKSITPEILKEVCQEIAGHAPDKEPERTAATRQNRPCSEAAVPVQIHGRTRARRNLMSTAHVLEPLTNRRESPVMVP
jgi:AAA domain